MNFGGGSPLPHHLSEVCIRIHIRRGNQRPRKLVEKRPPILQRQELRPRERIQNRTLKNPRTVHRQVPERERKHPEHVGSLCVTIRERQAKIGLVASAQQHVASIEVSGNVVRVAEKIRKGTLDDTHHMMISELVQMSSGGHNIEMLTPSEQP